MKRGTKLPPRKLTTAQQIFCREVVLKDNQSEAYRIAYPKSRKWKDASVWSAGAQLAAKPHVAQRISELRTKTDYRLGEITVERIMQELARLALFDPRKCYTPDGKLKNIVDMDEDTARAIAGIDVTPIVSKGRVVGAAKKVRNWDKHGALQTLARIKRMGTDEERDAPSVSEQAEKIRQALAGIESATVQPVSDGD